MPPQTSQPLAYALGAHPDDVEIFCLGLLLRLRAAGWRIGWAVATDGARGGDPDIRHGEACAAGATCGVTPAFLGLPDGALGADPRAPAVVHAHLAEARPALVVTHTPTDYHPDHRALARLVSEACAYDAALLFADGLFATGPDPDLLIDTTSVAAAKAAAIACHRSQAESLPRDTLDAWSRIRAAQSFIPGVQAAEAYTVPGWSRARALALLAPLAGETRR